MLSLNKEITTKITLSLMLCIFLLCFSVKIKGKAFNPTTSEPAIKKVDYTKEKWHLWRQKNQLSLFYRPYNKNLTELKAVLIINGTKDDFIRFLYNQNNIPNWLDNAKRAKVTLLNNTTSRLKVLFKGFLFISKREMHVLSSIHAINPTTIKVTIENDHVKNVFSKKAVAIEVIEASITIQTLTPKEIKVSYQVLADPHGNIPNWLIKTTSLSSMWKTMLNIQKLH